MNPARITAAHAVRLASQPNGVTARQLAEAAGCPLRTAQRCLADLASAGLLTVVVPGRRGGGDWQSVYRMVEVPE